MELNLAEIQYIRSLILADKHTNKYEENQSIKIAQDKSMHDFTEELLNKLKGDI